MPGSERDLRARLAARADELWSEEQRLLRVLGARLRELREAQGLRLVDLQERSGVGYRQLIRIEEGNSNITMRILARVARGLGVPPSALLEEQASKSGVRRKRSTGDA